MKEKKSKKQENQRGAVFVEGAIALPFFMFAIYILLSVVQIAYTQTRMAVALDSATKQMAEYVHVYFALELDEIATGEGGESSKIANEVADFLQDLGDGLGDVNDELGQYVDDAGNVLQGDSLTAIIQDGIGMIVAEQMMRANMVDSPSDTPEEFIRRNRIENLDMLGSKFLEAGEGSSGRDIFMRVNYDIRVVRLLGMDFSFHLSHCAYAQAWAGNQ